MGWRILFKFNAAADKNRGNLVSWRPLLTRSKTRCAAENPGRDKLSWPLSKLVEVSGAFGRKRLLFPPQDRVNADRFLPPFHHLEPEGLQVKNGRTNFSTVSLMTSSTPYSLVTPSKREARLTVSPITVKFFAFSDPMSPTIASP